MLILKNLSDKDLYQLLAEDNEEAFNLLYYRYWNTMLYKAVSKLKSSTDAEEVVQDTFLDLWKSRNRIQIRNSFRTYITAVLTYKIIAKIAGKKKLPQQSVEDLSQFYITDDGTQQWLNFIDLQAEIETIVKDLPEKCQLVFRMSREENKTAKQIAQELSLSQKTIEAHLHKALKSLRIALGKINLLMFLLLILLNLKNK